jgi:DNA replication and repair protein RecF
VRSWLGTLRLTDFRSYDRAELRTDGRSVYLFGPNGAGKTNLLEAISFLSPGRGLRGAALSEVGRRAPGESAGRAWAISVDVEGEHGSVRLGAGVESGTASRRIVRVDGETVASGVLTQHTRPIWLTPAQDRLFLEGSGERRRFFDRLVFAAAPDHAANVALYDRALRERTKLLADPPADPDWLTALESSMASAGARAASARARTLEDLQSEIDARGDRDFPSANLGLAGEWERLALAGVEGPAGVGPGEGARP